MKQEVVKHTNQPRIEGVKAVIPSITEANIKKQPIPDSPLLKRAFR